MENKRYKVYITLFVITTIVASCLAVYFGIKASSKVEQNFVQEGKVEEVATDEVEKQETNVEIKEVEKIVEKYGVFDFNVSNCLNKNNNNMAYDKFIDAYAYNFGFSCYLVNEGLTVSMNIDFDEFNKTFKNETSSTGRKTVEHTFDKKVVDIVMLWNGHDSNLKILFCLMEDGTVECMPLYNAFKTNNFKSFVKLEGVRDIVSIQQANVRITGGFGGHVTPVAFNKDGKFYDLGEIIYDMNIM